MEPGEFQYDAFISYSRRDIAFARRLHQALNSYRPPRDLPVPQRTLRVFRDETDFVGPEYHASLEQDLQNAATLIVICSPKSAASAFVADEITRFAACRGKEHVVTILLDGIPNNEAKPEELAGRAFPEQLIRLLPIPLAADYRGFDIVRDTVSKGRFAPAWFKTLADIYGQYGVDRNQIEQREQRRRAERLRNLAAASSAIALALVALTIWALLSRHEATVQRDLATAGQNEAEARLAFDASGDGLIKATLLSAASLRASQTVEGLVSMTRFLALLPRRPEWRQPPAHQEPDPGGTPARRHFLPLSPDGSQIAATDNGSQLLRLLDADTGREREQIATGCPPSYRTVLTYSPDGAHLAVGCESNPCVLDTAGAKECRPLARHGDMVWSAAFSADSKVLATASYHSDDVFIYDGEDWSKEVVKVPQGQMVSAMAISPDSQWLATTSSDGLRLWRLGQYQAPVAAARMAGNAWSIAFDADRSAVVTAGGELLRWRIVSDKEGPTQLELQTRAAIEAHTLLPVSWHGRPCFVAATSAATHLLCDQEFLEVLRIPDSSVAATIRPDGHRLINEEADGTMTSWPLEGGVDARRLAVGAAIRSLAIAKDRSWIAAGTDDGSVAILDSRTWKAREPLRVPDAVQKLSLSADGHWLVVNTNNLLRVFDTHSWTERKTEKYPGVLSAVGFAAGPQLLIAVGDKSVVGFSSVDWQRKFDVTHDGNIERVAVDPSGSRLATITQYAGGHDSGVHLARIVDLGSGAPLAWEYTGGGSLTNERMQELIAAHHTTAVGGDNALIAQSGSWPSLPLRAPDEVTSSDGVWKAAVSGSILTVSHALTGRVIGEWDAQSQLTDVLFLPENAPRWLVSAGDDGLLRFWPLTAQDLVAEACARLKRILTLQAWSRIIEAGQAVPGGPCAGYPAHEDGASNPPSDQWVFGADDTRGRSRHSPAVHSGVATAPGVAAASPAQTDLQAGRPPG